ncbi:MAG: MIP/aquaporin family protein [Gemmatimonadales bacterium]
MGKLFTEFVGTFFLVLVIGLTVVQGSASAPIAIGAMLTALVYLGGPISGAHYNPAISLAFLLRGTLPRGQFLPYVTAQLLGATSAAAAIDAMTGQTFAPAPSPAASTTAILLSEGFFTFVLALVILNVAISKRSKGNQYYGLAIGLVVMAGAFAAGPVSGGALNPAVGAGPTIVNALLGGGEWGNLWYYLVGPVLGAVAAVFAFDVQERSAA